MGNDNYPEKLPHIEIAYSNMGIPPEDSIKVWLEFVGIYQDAPWCAAALSKWLYDAGVKNPVRSALARDFLNRSPKSNRISAGRVLAGVVTVPEGSLVLLRRGDTIFGHIGIATERWIGGRGIYISANTSSPHSNGPEHTGGGIWEKGLSINPAAHIRITEFILIFY